jgi:hypothetical protein
MNFEVNRDWANNISEQLEHADNESIMEYFHVLEKKWTLPKNIDKLLKISENFNIENLDDIDANFIETQKNKIIWELTGVYNTFNDLTDLNDNDEYKLRWAKIYECFYYSERLIRTEYLLNRIQEDDYDYSLNEDVSVLFKFKPPNSDPKSKLLNLLEYIIGELADSELARYNDYLYKKITVNGRQTYAWEPYMKIRTYIIEKCTRTTKYDQWANLNSSGQTIKNAEAYFMECPDYELMPLVRDKHIFSFNNGVFLTKINKGTEKNPAWGTLFVPYGTKSEYLNAKTVSAKYTDEYFNDFPHLNEDDWFNIMDECPNFKKILDYQELSKEVQMWICILMGRCNYYLGELDNWQIAMYLLGQGGSGKSTILQDIISKWYEEDDVGQIVNNIEQQFGLKPLLNKLLVTGPEMQGDCKLEQTDFQLIIEGGKSSFAVKHQNPTVEYWRVPLIMAGNQLLGYKNSSEQVSRRTAVVNFWKKVIDTDQNLKIKLESELPIILKMCVSGYLWAVNNYGDKGIWKILPKYFHERKENMEEQTNPLQHFLNSSKVSMGSDKYILEKVFKQVFNDHCRENNLGRHKWDADFYSNTFSNNNITVSSKTKKRYPPIIGEMKTGVYYCGIDVVDETNDMNDEPE